MIISIFTPHGGCPERCSFCDQKTSGGTPTKPSEIVKVIEEHLSSAQNTQNIELAFYGGTFTGFTKQRQIQLLETVKPYLVSNQIQSIRISTRPDCIEKEWMYYLFENYKVQTAELGVQSFDPKVLAALGRTHSNEDVEKAVLVLKECGLRVGLHLMIGCPNETEGTDKKNIDYVLKIRPDTIRIHPLLVLKDTHLAQSFKKKEFEPISLEDAIQRASLLTECFENNEIRVIRLGLQPQEILSLSVLAGPYHPAFGELVRNRIVARAVLEKIKESNVVLNPKEIQSLRSHSQKEFLRLPSQIRQSIQSQIVV
ncbi:MAG: elongator complex protein 3 [Bacteriovoracia bacterium]